MTWKRGAQKYGSTKVSHAGYSFASKLEAALYDHLKLLELANELKDLKCQDTVYLTDARIMYKPDFRFHCLKTDKTVWAEAKGFETTDWRIKRRLWEHYGPGPLQIWKGSGRSLKIVETLTP